MQQDEYFNMNRPSHGIPRPPLFPQPLTLPLRLIPVAAHSSVLARVLNRVFAPELADGELDFLAGKVMAVNVSDAGLNYRITLAEGALKAAPAADSHDLSIEGTLYDFLLLASRQEDADTLFFNRRLRLGGDTELGLYVKNFLDAVELEERLGPFLKLLDGATSLVGRIPAPGDFPFFRRSQNA
jgi:predicted lipid carrier protein YhbT